MNLTGDAARVLQVHPTRRCNLACLHCYSLSGPEQPGALEASLLREAISDAASLGYNRVSVSGGEPLLYPPLAEVLRAARGAGMATTVTTNGMLLDERRLHELSGALDLVAISLDGAPATHDRLRGSPRAFETMRARLEAVRGSGIPFGFIFTLTRHNLEELPWAVEFAAREGASLLQVHPLEEAGRAVAELPGWAPDDVASALAWVVMARLKAVHAAGLALHVDLVDRDMLRAWALLQPWDGDRPAEDVPALADELSPLVIEADGWVVPLQYGFPREHALGCLAEAPLRDLADRWRLHGRGGLRDLIRRTMRQAGDPARLPLMNLYGEIVRAAGGAAAPA